MFITVCGPRAARTGDAVYDAVYAHGYGDGDERLSPKVRNACRTYGHTSKNYGRRSSVTPAHKLR